MDTLGTVAILSSNVSLLQKCREELVGRNDLKVIFFRTVDQIKLLQENWPICILIDPLFDQTSRLHEKINMDVVLDSPIILMMSPVVQQHAVAAVKAGIFDVLDPFLNVDCLYYSVRKALEIAIQLCAERLQVLSDLSRFQTLCARERSIVHLVAEGWLNKQIGDRLGISTVTTKMYRGRIVKKLELFSVAQFVFLSRNVLIGLQLAADRQDAHRKLCELLARCSREPSKNLEVKGLSEIELPEEVAVFDY